MLLCCLVAEDEPGPVMFDKHVEKSLKGFVNYFIVLCLKSIQWAVCVNVGVQVFVRAANVCASGLWVITKAPQWRSSDILHSASPCCGFPFTPTESWQTLTSSYTHLISDRAINTSWPFTHRTTVWGTLHTTGASPRRPDHEHINPQSTHTHTYSEIWTKMSAPPSDGVINPWPLEREKYLHMPVNTGPSDARAVLHRKHITERWETWAQSRLMNQQRQIPRKTRHIWNKHFILKGRWLLTSWLRPVCSPADPILRVRTAAGQPAHSAGLAPSELLKTFTLKQVLLCSSTTREALHDSQNTNSCLHHTEPRVKETHVLIHKIQSNACAHCLKVHV